MNPDKHTLEDARTLLAVDFKTKTITYTDKKYGDTYVGSWETSTLRPGHILLVADDGLSLEYLCRFYDTIEELIKEHEDEATTH